MNEDDQLFENLIEENRTRTRAFNYNLNEKKAKKKLLEGAYRSKHLDIEKKSTCVNMRLSDGAYHQIILPLLNEWKNKIDEPTNLLEKEITIKELNTGFDKSEKHMDTKVVLMANNIRIVLHA